MGVRTARGDVNHERIFSPGELRSTITKARGGQKHSPPAGSHFLTSDNPIHWNDPAAGPPWNAGLLSPKTVLSFPMSFELCLMGSWHRRLPLAREAPPEIVDVANRRTIQFAHEQVYTSSRHEVEAALDLRDEFGRAGEPLGPRPLTLRVVEDADELAQTGEI